MRKLATIRKVTAVNPIKGKDRVEMATIDGWTCMVSKADNFKEGSLCIFCEPDSVFPPTEQWEFLKKYNYRIKTQRFKDADNNYIYSQGLALPLSALPEKPDYNGHPENYFKIGDDVTSLLDITQYEPTMDKEPNESASTKKYPKFLMRFKWFRKLVLPKKDSKAFPSFIGKTDEERIQNCPSILETDTLWVATEKLDGQSGTFAMERLPKKWWQAKPKYKFYVCSRNFNLPVKDNSSYWTVAEKYHIEAQLRACLEKYPFLQWMALQGECVAPRVQGNKYKVSAADLYIFNVKDSYQGRFPSLAGRVTAEAMGLKFVPIIATDVKLTGKTVQEVLQMSNGQSAIGDTPREGIVFRSADGKQSFKAVSPEFLLKYGE